MSWRDEMYSETERALQAEVNRLRMVVRSLDDQIEGLKNQIIDWIPANSGILPEEGENVQVTYLGYYDDKPYCDGMAYLENGKWYWSDDNEEIIVKITAWKPTGEPYREETKDKYEE